jgi:hypothetical protein
VLGVATLPEERLEHRHLRLLELQEERVVVIAADQQQDPGAGTDAADAADLPCRMDVAIALEQAAAVAWQRAAVRVDHVRRKSLEVRSFRTGQDVLDRRHERGLADDSELAVHRPTELREGAQAVLRVDVDDVRVEARAPFALSRRSERPPESE